MRLAFILGTHPSLSVAEILAVLGQETPGDFTVVDSSRHALIVDFGALLKDAAAAQAKASQLMRRLGGTVKIGTLLDVAPEKEADIIAAMAAHLEAARAGHKTVTFGFSVYSLDAEGPANRAGIIHGRLRKTGMETKRLMKEAGFSARWVAAQEGVALSSVAVAKNKMLEEGAEFLVFAKKDSYTLGITLAVQPFEEFSAADYGRPERDAVQGMLPPKLARLMVNLSAVGAGADTTLLDPFCGSGTVLTEALLVGVGHALGSDANPVAIESTLKNVQWFKNQAFIGKDADAQAKVCDARNLAQNWPLKSIDAVVSEVYLGPPRTGKEKRGDLQRTLHELGNLYYQSFTAMKKVLKPGAPVLLALPAYVIEGERHGINLADFTPIGVTPELLLPQPIMARLGNKPTRNLGLYYGRKDQLVWREIVKFRFA